MNPRVIFLTLAAGAVVLLASIVPASALGSYEHDITVGTTARWKPLGETWNLDGLGILETEPSPILNFGALLRNAFSMGGLFFGTSSSKVVQFTLETPQGLVLDNIKQSSGRGGIVANEKPLKVTFRNVEPGQYVIRAKILDDDGTTLAEQTRQMHLVGGKAS